MPFYLQWKYNDPAIKAMADTPQDRPTERRKAVGAFDGRLHPATTVRPDYRALASYASHG